MKAFLYKVTCLALLVFTCQACQALSGGGIKDDSSKQSGAEQGKVLFQDDFSNSSKHWTLGEDNIGVAEYKEKALRIYVNTDVAAKVSVLHLQPFTDSRMEVDAVKTAGPDDNDFGIVCRFVDENNFYFFEISSDGYYGIGKYKDNQLRLMSADQMQSSDTILQAAARNHIRADCVGATLSLYVNGKKLAQVNDTDFRSGSAGLIAGTFQTPGADILFDNFIIFQP
jgi:hypothetical protein